MIRNRIVLKAFAVFFIVELLFSTLLPAVSWALTAGPTAPEATSFEPVDTTDIVDLKTGDFVYNIPLLEVPGPAGSYPLSLSYHAGILPDQEASWTGLGFTLNAGSITRLVNGYPDDHNAITDVDRSFWNGGETTTKEIGISVGIANVATVSAGLAFAQDTYKGRGVGGYVGVGFANVNSQFGVSPFGDPYSSIGISLGIAGGSREALNISGHIGLNFNSDGSTNAGVTSGVGVGKTNLMNASINSDNLKVSLSVGGGAKGVFNSKSNHVSINSESSHIDIPIPYTDYSIRLGRDYQRYWIDETVSSHTYGALYLGEGNPSAASAFDTYDMLDTNLDISTFDDEEKVLGGSFPDVDSYLVTGQGISGSIQPYHFKQHLYRQDKDGISKSYPLSTASNRKPVEFRFVNDFSNRFEYTPGEIHSVLDNSSHVSYSFDFLNNQVTGQSGNDGYDQDKNSLAGSKYVKWYTNNQILKADPNTNPFDEGFIDCTAEDFDRQGDAQIGGYAITNSSGVTYHYALPAYSYNEYMKTTNSAIKQLNNGIRYNELKKPAKYAYTWFLTAVTGPDYVDANHDNLADNGDWGYWVNFEYKKWLGDYKWRNPGEGTNRDLDGDFEFFSSGLKEVYYLDKIITQSHVAVFEKSERLDGREVTDLINGGFEPVGNTVPRPGLKLDRIKLYTYDSYIRGHTSDDNLLREIVFGYDADYSLATGTPNSYSEENPAIKKGRLTLQTLSFLGKRGVSLLPPISFDYKNIPYDKDKVDVWGYYKSDFSADFRDKTNEIIGRLTSDSSALNIDAWSLNKITTPIGTSIVVEYESDQYDEAILAQQQFLRTHDVTDYGPDKLKITFWEQDDLSKYFVEGQNVEIDLVGSFNNKNSRAVCSGDCDNTYTYLPYGYDPFSFSAIVTVESININDKFIIVNNHDFYNKLKNETKKYSKVISVDGYDYNRNPKTYVYTYDTYYENAHAWPDFFPTGIVSVPQIMRYGGGLRVKSIGLQNPSNGDQLTRVTSYEYKNGKTSYEPYQILSPMILPEYRSLVDPIQTTVFYKKFILNKFYRQINISRLLPGPGVLYQYVTVKEKNITEDGQSHDLPNYTTYEFELFKEGMINVAPPTPVSKNNASGNYDNVDFKYAYLNNIIIKDFSSRTGDLRSITLYNSLDNTPISSTQNNYLYDNLDESFSDNVSKYEISLAQQFSNQGLIEQSFSRARLIFNKQYDKNPYPGPWTDKWYFPEDQVSLLGTISKIETYPSVSTGQTNINYKTGIVTRSNNISFDYYSGEATQVLNTDSYGNNYLSVSTPAYKHYSGMGLKVDNIANRNMLTQRAEQYAYVVNSSNVPTGLLSASIQTWSDQVKVLNLNTPQANIWRPQSSYQWNGDQSLSPDGSYPYSDFSLHPFTNWSNSVGINDLSWEKTGELTLYDIYSHALEGKDINENYASTRMNNDQDKVIASATSARYSEMAFSGAEYYPGNTEADGGVDRGDGNPSQAHVHTGQYSLLVDVGGNGFNYTLDPTTTDLTKKYRASVWVYAPGVAETQEDLNKVQLYYTVNNHEYSINPIVQKNKSKSWYLLSMDIAVDGANEIYIGVRNNTTRGVYFDDFRVHPLNASLTAYVYDSFSGELNYILDANNFYTRFEYDAMGRLVRTSKELLNFDFGDGKESYRADAIVKETKYNYGKGN